MQLNKENLQIISSFDNLSVPQAYEFLLPEKVLQFGTGVLLRGLPDYFISKANREKIFNGRVVVVKSTDRGDAAEFSRQDCLFSHELKGIYKNNLVKEYFINASISKVLIARFEWQKILEYAKHPQLEIIISNTTEAGIVLNKADNIHAKPPESFPGKLLSFLYDRYKFFNASVESGMVIIPTELITENAVKLKNILVELALLNRLGNSFVEWMITANDFCSSLVDRIVSSSKISEDFLPDDELSIESEPYALWAIETTSSKTKNTLSFAAIHSGVIITNDIKKFRELKLRLLNATHTFSCGLALLYGFKFVNEALQNVAFKNFLEQLMYDEIVPCITNEEISIQEAQAFAGTVISRFENPYIHHRWLSITAHYTEKLKERCAPLINKYVAIFSKPPQKMALGFAAYLIYTKADVEKTLSDNKLWNENLNMPGFNKMVTAFVCKIKNGVDLSALSDHL